MLSFLSMEYISLPLRNDALLSKALTQDYELKVDSSHSLGMHFKGNCRLTFPNFTLTTESNEDWCSIVHRPSDSTESIKDNEKPFITFSLAHKLFELTSYSVRNGCCKKTCCCSDKKDKLNDVYCCCRLYSFSLWGSNNNKTWIRLQSVERDMTIRICEARTYRISYHRHFKFIKFQIDEGFPKCPFCAQVNQIEFYGKTYDTNEVFDYTSESTEEETISIIGKVRKDLMY